MVQQQEELLTELHKVIRQIKHTEQERDRIIQELSDVMREINTVCEHTKTLDIS